MGKIGGYIGAIVGICGWLIGLSGVCLVTGNADVLSKFFWPALAISLSMGFTLAVVLECILRLYGRGHYMFSTTLWGLLLFDVGVLMLLHNHWIVPILESSPKLVEALERMNAGGRRMIVWRTGDTMSLVSVCAGAALLACVALKVIGDALRRPDPKPK